MTKIRDGIKDLPRVRPQDRAGMIRLSVLSSDRVSEFGKDIDMAKYAAPKRKRIVKANPFNF